jgi:hypothetical protein
VPGRRVAAEADAPADLQARQNRPRADRGEVPGLRHIGERRRMAMAARVVKRHAAPACRQRSCRARLAERRRLWSAPARR